MGKDLKENHSLVSVRLFRPEFLANNHKMKISLLIIMMISIQGSLIFLGMVSQGMPLLHPMTQQMLLTTLLLLNGVSGLTMVRTMKMKLMARLMQLRLPI